MNICKWIVYSVLETYIDCFLMFSFVIANLQFTKNSLQIQTDNWKGFSAEPALNNKKYLCDNKH